MGERRNTDRVKEWLWRYRKAKLDVLGLEAEYEALLIAQESARAVRYDGAGSSGKVTDLSDLMVARERVLERLNQKRKDMSSSCTEIIDVANELGGLKRTIIILRYVHLRDGYRASSLAEIARALDYSTSHVKRIHQMALEELIDKVDTN